MLGPRVAGQGVGEGGEGSAFLKSRPSVVQTFKTDSADRAKEIKIKKNHARQREPDLWR